MVHEVVVYIHGVSKNRAGESHRNTYNKLHDGISQHVAAESPWKDAKVCYTEWGWNFDNDKDAAGHKLLTPAQTMLGERLWDAFDKAPWDFTLHPARLALMPIRKMAFYGFGDMFYYVSPEGKDSVRAAIIEQIQQTIGPWVDDPDSHISLTLVGHSAGSVIALDLSFFLFSGKDYSFVTAAGDSGSTAKHRETLDKWRQLAAPENKRLRLRRMITFGSPIPMLACRNDDVLGILATGGKIDPALHGLTANPDTFGHPLTGPRWINILDIDDPIAYPVEPLMADTAGAVKDVFVDVSDWVHLAHDAYWSNNGVHELIASQW